MKLARVAALLLASCWAATGIAAAAPAPTPGPSPGPTPGAPPGQPKTAMNSDGSYAVGTDIVPGTYRSDGPVDGQACYWKRLNGEQIIDNSLSKKPQVVLIEPTDTAFKTHYCQPWQLTECPPTCAPVQSQIPGLPDVLKGFLDLPAQPPPAPAPAPAGR